MKSSIMPSGKSLVSFDEAFAMAISKKFNVPFNTAKYYLGQIRKTEKRKNIRISVEAFFQLANHFRANSRNSTAHCLELVLIGLKEGKSPGKIRALFDKHRMQPPELKEKPRTPPLRRV